jgi:hypothetical protein
VYHQISFNEFSIKYKEFRSGGPFKKICTNIKAAGKLILPGLVWTRPYTHVQPRSSRCPTSPVQTLENSMLHTTGAGCFAEGPRLSAKPLRPSAKPLPSAALGKAPSAKIRSAKASLPRAVYRALSKAFAESPTLGKA